MRPRRVTTKAEPSRTWIVSGLFWLALLTAGLLYGAVALSPRLAIQIELRQRYREGQIQLVQMEQQIAHLERVSQAIAQDTHFKEQLARVDFDAIRPGEEVLAVDPSTAVDARLAIERPTLARPSRPWYGPLVTLVAESPRLRRGLLLGSATLILFSFGFLHPSQADRLLSAARTAQKATGQVLDRYRLDS